MEYFSREYFSYHPSLWHIPVVRHVPAVLPDLHWRLAVSQKPDFGAFRNASSIYCDNRSLCSHYSAPPPVCHLCTHDTQYSLSGNVSPIHSGISKKRNVCSLSLKYFAGGVAVYNFLIGFVLMWYILFIGSGAIPASLLPLCIFAIGSTLALLPVLGCVFIAVGWHTLREKN